MQEPTENGGRFPKRERQADVLRYHEFCGNCKTKKIEYLSKHYCTYKRYTSHSMTGALVVRFL